MGFWSTAAAAPVWMDRLMGRSGFLRPTLAAEPRRIPGVQTPRMLTPADCTQLCTFWRTHYGGRDWILDAQPAWVLRYLDDQHVIKLVCCAEDGTWIATIVSTPFNGAVYVGTTTWSQLRMVEGLCVTQEWRRRGIAGYMIAYLDFITSGSGPVGHLWSRELPYVPLLPTFTTAAAVTTYSYIKCNEARARISIQNIQWATFETYWRAGVIGLRDPHAIVATVPDMRDGEMEVWRSASMESEARHGSRCVVLLNTRRITRDHGEPIWEVIWRGRIQDNRVAPAYTDATYDDMYESLAAERRGLLFTTDTVEHTPWHSGTSGMHATYTYNFLPPTFGGCDIVALRGEI